MDEWGGGLRKVSVLSTLLQQARCKTIVSISQRKGCVPSPKHVFLPLEEASTAAVTPEVRGPRPPRELRSSRRHQTSS